MKEVSEKVMRNMIFEVLHVERKNSLRTRQKQIRGWLRNLQRS